MINKISDKTICLANNISSLSYSKKNIKKTVLRDITGVVVRSVQETSDTWTHYMYINKENMNYKAGQFLSISPKQFPELQEMVAYLEYIKGKKESIRAYSMTSAPNEKYVSITVKAESFDVDDTKYPPLLSPFLSSQYIEGREIKFRGYTGSYYLKEDHGNKTDEVLHIVAGSGIVPSFSILKDELLENKNINVKHTLIYVNRTYKDMIFYKEINDLARKFPKRFKLINLITREDTPEEYGANFFKGRPTFDLISSNIKDTANVLVFSCGAAITRWQKDKAKKLGIKLTPRFLDSIKEIITKLGIEKRRFKYEDYG